MPQDTTRSQSRGIESAPHVLRRLVVLHAAPRLKRAFTVILGDEPIAIGRAGHTSGPLAFADDAISRAHAVVFPGDGGARIVDRGSRNGTFVAGARVTEAALRNGAIVRTGNAILLYQEIEIEPGECLEPEWPHLRGPSVAMQRVRAALSRVAPTSVAVLVDGESGVGKEVVAEAVHRASGRKGPFVPVNCAAIAEGIAESEIFGHTAGAFTGAARGREGFFAAADGGTLFLDEIGELPITLQPKLLRALAKGEVRPVGASAASTVDVRIVAATNRDLDAEVDAGRFRGDLLARLSAWKIRVPPLRDRAEDVLPLAAVFLDGELSTDAAEALLLHAWPYNVRELEQTMAAARLRLEGTPLGLAHLPPAIARHVAARGPAARPGTAPPLPFVVPRDEVPSKHELALVIDELGGNVAKVAAYFGKHRQQIYRWAQRHELPLKPEKES
jgi:DNA-binding NtrC family response regulator